MEKKNLKLSNQETLAYLEFGDPKNPTILLVHGNMSSGVHYEPLFEGLMESFHVLAPDLRGFGDSSYINPISSLEDFAADLSLFLDALNIEKVLLAGWSTGGGIGLKFAALYPEKISKLVLIESASYKGYPIYKKDASYQPILTELYQTKEAMAQDPVQVLPAYLAMQNNDETFMKQVWQMAIYNVKMPEEMAFNRYIKETLKQRNLIDVDWALMTFNMSDHHNGVVKGDQSIRDVKCPVLSIYGKKDFIILESMFKETVEALKNCETLILENGSHSPITDEPQTIIQAIQRFNR
jgi:2-hydroxy-6-oxonona-2,4-dienedioate hydrolase